MLNWHYAAPALNITNMPSQMLYKNGLLYVAGSSVINYDNQTVFVYAYNVSANYAYVPASACCVIEPARLGYSRAASCSGCAGIYATIETAWCGRPAFRAARPALLPSSPT